MDQRQLSLLIDYCHEQHVSALQVLNNAYAAVEKTQAELDSVIAVINKALSREISETLEVLARSDHTPNETLPTQERVWKIHGAPFRKSLIKVNVYLTTAGELLTYSRDETPRTLEQHARLYFKHVRSSDPTISLPDADFIAKLDVSDPGIALYVIQLLQTFAATAQHSR